jgi:hypothetical protein
LPLLFFQELKKVGQNISHGIPDFVERSFSEPATSATVAHPLMRKVFDFPAYRTLLLAFTGNRLERVFFVTRFATARTFAAKPSVTAYQTRGSREY